VFRRRIGVNASALAQLAFDALPRRVVALDSYRRLRRRLSASPRRYESPPRGRPVASRGEWKGRKLATAATDLVVEGFPGSGNSFLSNCLRRHVGAAVSVESHFHYTAQLKRALAFGVPAVVLVRSPADAWRSLKSKEPLLADWVIGLRWILYHRWVLRNVSALHVFTFDEVVEDVDVLRRCRAIRRFVDGEIARDLSYRRESPERIAITTEGLSGRLLLEKAEKLFRQIREQRRAPC
jgi:hypothetical protein